MDLLLYVYCCVTLFIAIIITLGFVDFYRHIKLIISLLGIFLFMGLLYPFTVSSFGINEKDVVSATLTTTYEVIFDDTVSGLTVNNLTDDGNIKLKIIPTDNESGDISFIYIPVTQTEIYINGNQQTVVLEECDSVCRFNLSSPFTTDIKKYRLYLPNNDLFTSDTDI